VLESNHLLGDSATLGVDTLIVVLGGLFFSRRRAETDPVSVPLHSSHFAALQKGFTSYEYLTDDWVSGSPTQAVEVIERAAQNSVKECTRFSADVEVELYEVWPSHCSA